jgi:hypothetical protein
MRLSLFSLAVLAAALACCVVGTQARLYAADYDETFETMGLEELTTRYGQAYPSVEQTRASE